MDDKDYTAHLLEEIRDQNKAILEVVSGQPTRGEFEELRQDVTELKQDVKTIKAAVGDLSRDLAKHVRQPSHEGHVVKTRRLPW